MNRVQTVTKKHHRVENQVEKPSRVHEHPTGPTGTPRCALARPGARMAVRGRTYRGRVPAVSWPGTGRIVGASVPCRGCQPAVSQRSARACLAPGPSTRAPQPNLPSYLATIQYFVLQPNSSQTKHLSHDTNFVS